MLRHTTKRLTSHGAGGASRYFHAQKAIGVATITRCRSNKQRLDPSNSDAPWAFSACALIAGGMGSFLVSDGDRSITHNDSSSTTAIAAIQGSPLNASDSARWESVLKQCIPAVVSIKVNATRSFDTNAPGASQATGFVVDASQGLILTNRHVVQSGPVLAEALFQNHEEVPLRAVYRDPVHDFGLFQFDPSRLRHLKVPELPLHPELAKVGLDIRVMGNNAGEKLAILSGTLARLDRGAPNYGRNSFNDHNTFYFQAASNTSGGSSGSPVINADGKVVALNAAGMVGTASSYYLPLDRVKRAVDLIRTGQPVDRGTLQTTFEYRPFNELARVGLPEHVEAAVRKHSPEGVGMLCVSSLVPEGPGHHAGLQPGDVLVSMKPLPKKNQASSPPPSSSSPRVVTLFPDLEEILDGLVGESLELEVYRGGRRLLIQTTVQDLHAITPASFLEMGESIFHDLSYHMARNHSCPAENQGVYVCQAGYMLREAGVTTGSLILSVAGSPTPTLAHLQQVLEALPDGAEVPVRVRHVSNRHQSALTMLRVDRTWFPAQRVERLEVATNKSVAAAAAAADDAADALPTTDHFSDWQVTRCAPPPSPPAPSSVSSPAQQPPPSEAAKTTQDKGAMPAEGYVRTPPDLAVKPQQRANAPPPPPPPLSEPLSSETKRRSRFPPGANKAEAAVSQSLVQVYFNMPYMIDGTAGSQFLGTGVVVDEKKGLVLVDRNTVPCSLGDVHLSIGSSLEIPAKVEFIHPLHNLAVLRYDPALVGSTPIREAVLAPRLPQAPAPPTASANTNTSSSSSPPSSVKVFKDETPQAQAARSGNTATAAATAKSGSEGKAQRYTIVGLAGNRRSGTQLVSKQVKAATVASHGQPVTISHPPRFQETNLEVMALEGGMQGDGVVVNEQGQVAGLYASFSMQMNHGGRLQNVQAFQAIPSEVIHDLVDPLKENSNKKPPVFRALGLEFEYVGLSQLRGMGLDDGFLSDLEASLTAPPKPFSSSSSASPATAANNSNAQASPAVAVGVPQAPAASASSSSSSSSSSSGLGQWPPRLLAVKRRWGGYPAQNLVQDGDVLLKVQGKPTNKFRDIELACASSSSSPSSSSSLSSGLPPVVSLELLRGGKRVTLEVPTVELGSDETKQVLLWGGAVLQQPPQAVARQRGMDCKGVYVAANHRGSPAGKFGLSPTCRIVEVDGVPTPDLAAFLAVVKDKQHGESVRIKQEDLRGVPTVSALKLDLTYWPTFEIARVAPTTSGGGSGGGGGGGGGASGEELSHEEEGSDNRHTWRRRRLTPQPRKAANLPKARVWTPQPRFDLSHPNF